MWLKPASSKSRRRTAAAESPPPTTLKASESIVAWAMAEVPTEKAGNSNTPIGPFHTTVLAARITSAKRWRSEEHTSELQSRGHLVCRLLLEKKKTTKQAQKSN